VHNCQDFSVSGKRKGAAWTCSDCGHEHNPLEVHYTKRGTCPICGSSNLKKTRSSLIVEYLRMIREKKPNFAVYENVKNIVGKDFKQLFNAFLDELHEYGYNTYYQVLNAKHFGIPQNRERVILIIIKKELDNGKFKFPETFDSGIRLIHVLENSVAQKYYVNNEKAETLLRTLSKEAMENISNTNSPIFTDVKPAIENAVEKESDEAVQNKFCVACRGRYKENPNLRISGLPTEQRLEPNLNGTVNTLTSVQKDNLVMEQEILVDKEHVPHDGWDKNAIDIKVESKEDTYVYANCCIRRLTPLECFRLMGFSDEDFYRAQKGETIMSDTQLYKQAGNSIVTNVLYYTYVELYKAMPYLFDDVKLLSLFSGIGAFEKAFYMLQKYINDPNYIPNDYRKIIAENKPVRVGQVSSDGSQAGTVYSDQNIAPTICAGCHGYAMGYIYTENFTKPPMN
jgi:DNA (cytosine-5)-methyltransferase 1